MAGENERMAFMPRIGIQVFALVLMSCSALLVACGDNDSASEPGPTTTEPEPTTTEPEPTTTDPAEPSAASESAGQLATRAYVEAAIARYESDGRDATVAYYNSPESIEGERVLVMLEESDRTILAHASFPIFVGDNTPFSTATPLGRSLAKATAEGYWFEGLSYDPVTLLQTPSLFYAVVHDGLIFLSTHVAVREDLEAFTKDYVRRAMELYDREGREAAVAYYDSRDNVEGSSICS